MNLFPPYLSVAYGAAVLAVAISAPDVLRAQSSPQPLSRIERLEAWVAAIERHAPGVTDAPVREVSTWSQDELQQAWIDLRTVIGLIREPSVRLFFVQPEWTPRALRSSARPRNRQVLYSRSEFARIRTLADEIVKRGGENRLLKRGALLHGNIAMLGPLEGRQSDRTRPGPSRTTLFLTDGRPLGLGSDVNHFEISRRMLDLVRPEGAKEGTAPDPSTDETVRLWYVAIGAFMQNVEQLDLWHFERALEIFPTDADILFLSACFHEMLSTPRIQSAIRTATLPRDVKFDIGSTNSELREAEQLFRRALQRTPESVEARLRLGRVLGRLGRHSDAATELRRAISGTNNSLLLYYGHLFLGAEAEALGSVDEARRVYERASALFPTAQSPRLALSHLETRTGNRAAALEAIQDVMAWPADSQQPSDPWWRYHLSQTRSVDSLMGQLYKTFRTGPPQ